ncbi:MAG TPA: CpXC domain-containing protein, partial [Anaerolineae bacterium]|nr:CpXC domain-containing protein [Anaerolineae bacterium]
MATQQIVSVTCPNCRTQFNVPMQPIIDGQNPTLKSAFLQGRLNAAQCPQCGFVSPLNIPMLYYDLEKELALVLSPNSLQLAGPDQEKMIGTLTNTLVNSLPAEKRKFYLFNPKV